MDAAAVRVLVRQLIAETAPLAVACVEGDTLLRDELGFDSLGLLELAGIIEQALGLSVGDDDDAADVERVADIELLVLARLEPKGLAR